MPEHISIHIAIKFVTYKWIFHKKELTELSGMKMEFTMQLWEACGGDESRLKVRGGKLMC